MMSEYSTVSLASFEYTLGNTQVSSDLADTFPETHWYT